MATTSSRRTHRMRSALAAVACTLSVSLISTTTPAVAQENTSVASKLQDVLDGNVSVASLAGAIADAQEEISRLESEIGEFRERANQALVDLQDARNLSEQARRGTVAARGELDDAQLEVEDAQGKLDEISRSAYRRANTSESVTNAAGGDAREDMLTRQSYLRSQAERQQNTVTELERVRTEKSNKESQLRKAEQLATERESNAVSAENDARGVLEENESRIGEIASEREQLVALQEEAQQALSSARGEEPTSDESENNDVTEDTSAAPAPATSEEATSEVAEDTASETAEQDTTVAEANEPSADENETATSSESETASESESSSSTNGYAASAPVGAGPTAATVTEPSATNTEESESAVTTEEQASSIPSQDAQGANGDAQGSSVDGEQAAQLAGLAVTAAAAIVAASQPTHSVDAENGAQAGAEGDVASENEGSSEALIAGSSALFPQQGPAAEDDVAGDLDGILEDLTTPGDIEDEASAELGNASRAAKIDAVIARAESQIGVPYAWGGGDANGPTKGIRDGGVADSHGDYNKVGFDCSGLTLYAFAGAGISLPHFTGYQYNQGKRINPQEMERGDLIFYGPSGNHHVAIYQGNGMMIEAPQSGQTVASVPVRWSGMSDYAVRLI
ncbi:DIP1281 family NlpC/P60 protein [Corynebacterium casei]|uniref:DIP1281 family NlpC/P60 protein n=1 Tax=Corynebacterium casei TaxID=160386 RepID=UPI0034555E10